jgi:hypothetical protein
MSDLGEFKGLRFEFPDGDAAHVESFSVIHDMNILRDDGKRFTLRSTVKIVNNRLRAVVNLLDDQGVPVTNEEMDDESLRSSIADTTYWLLNADAPRDDN